LSLKLNTVIRIGKAMKYKLLVVEDEPEMLSGIADNLEFEGYEVDIAENGEIAIEKLESHNYDLVISDVMMPKVSGFDLVKYMKKNDIKSGLILLTARSQEIDKVRGLELGADDYISKPFSLREFLARVKAVLRRYSNQKNIAINESSLKEEIAFGIVKIYPKTWQVFKGDVEINLSHKEVELLLFFSENANNVISRDELLTNVWGYQDLPTTRTVDNFILRLRQKIEPEPSQPRHLLTVHGIGYKYVT